MDTIDKGILAIETDENNCKRVIFVPVNGTIRLSKCELTELFGVYRQTINAVIEAILKTNVFKEEETGKCRLIVKTSKIKIAYEPYEFGLIFIIAMAFRIDSENAEILRKWVADKMLISKISLPINIQNYGLN